MKVCKEFNKTIPGLFKYEFKGENMDTILSVAILASKRVVLKNMMLNVATKEYNKTEEIDIRKLLRAKKIIYIVIIYIKCMERMVINDCCEKLVIEK